MTEHVTTLKRKVEGVCDPSHSIKRQCFNNINNTVGGVYTTRNITPPEVDHSEDEVDDDEEDDWSFYGVSKRSAVLPPLSPPMIYSEDEDDDSAGICKRRSSTINDAYDDQKNILLKKKQQLNSKKAYRRRKRVMTVPDSDLAARARCFDYLVGAIDEVWAQYCDCTSSAEVQMYGGDDALPCSPVSLYDGLATSDAEDNGVAKSVNEEDDETNKGVERSIQLMNLKKRLLNAKYFFSELLDNPSWDASAQFWKRWDLVKYSTIDLVEDSDEDEVVERVCDEIEEGRAYHSY